MDREILDFLLSLFEFFMYLCDSWNEEFWARFTYILYIWDSVDAF
jgi:hypothetical protein